MLSANERMIEKIVWIVIIVVTVNLISIYESDATNATPLTQDDKQLLVEKLGLDGYKELHKNGCIKSVNTAIKTKQWDDTWCAEHYKHVNFGE